MKACHCALAVLCAASLATLGVEHSAAAAPPTQALAKGSPNSSDALGAPDALGASVFARVDDLTITAHQFAGALRQGVRRKFYHGKVPETELPRFQREVGEALIDRVLVVRAARARGLKPDPSWVEARLENVDRRYQSSPQWRESRDRVLAMVTGQLHEDSLFEQMREQMQGIDAPDENTLRAFYRGNPALFTEPERFRVSAILLKVPPSSPTSVWKAAEQEAQQIVARLRAGADFAEMARLRSGDASADKGGDLGYLHRGMLGEAAQAAVDKAQIGAFTDPVVLLEGVGIFSVAERPAPRLRGFAEVRERALELWLREQRQSAWVDFTRALRSAAKVQVNTDHYLPLESGDEVARR